MSAIRTHRPIRPIALALLLALLTPWVLAAPAADAAAPEAAAPAAVPDYSTEVQPIFDRRCIACHGCLGSPCNVKLDSFRGADRGGFGMNAYSNHLTEWPRTDMDAANSIAAWRERGFFPVLADTGSPRQNLDASLLYQLVAAGTANNKPGFDRNAVDPFRLERFAGTCPATTEALAARLSEHPALGMPFGLPAISEDDFATLKAWVAGGSPGPSAAEQAKAETPANPAEVAAWEGFFNDPDPRQGLVSRYIFEHVYLASIVLEGSPGERFRLVRSITPPARLVDAGTPNARYEGEPVAVIGTGLPYDDPYTYANVDQFWYRLQKLPEAPVQKNQWVWRLGAGDIDHLKKLFYGTDWSAPTEPPPWGVDNPFLVFAAVPAEARYRFMLENAEVVVGGITYGPVCNGQTATYAVKDHFWVFFLDPAHDVSVQDPELGRRTWDVFMDRSVFGDAAYENAYAKAQAELYPDGFTPDAIWDGGGTDPNALLTVLRHETNVSVLKGARGGLPPTFWLVGYSGFERMYYDTVAAFKYWAGDIQKLQTLLFFNYLRQEFEDNFLLLLPEADRDRVRDEWTRGIGSLVMAFVPFADADQPGAIANGAHPLRDVVNRLTERLGPAISELPDRLNPTEKPKVDLAAPMTSIADWETAISTLTAVKGLPFVPQLPSVIMLRLRGPAGAEQVYSLVANRVYLSQYTLLFENAEAVPAEDTMSVYPTILNGFPNLFVDLDLADAPRFLTELTAVKDDASWHGFVERWVIHRNSERFWPFYDWINAWNLRERGDDAGWLDLTYYDTPEM